MRCLGGSEIHRIAATVARARLFSSSRPYNPNVVNECVNPKPGRPFKVMRLLGGFGCFMLATPLILMHFDTKRFEAELERRRQEEAARED
ncbi:hypothetical protein, conserved [Babesia bigemina]|uniref:Uncharacterized protein n=1 Tax=Babesia bigemina TaxID=5866 RepID=A0A061D8F0_BABBI|nr:hypothetical protein, conserved [Babesia bigemina]CDR96252.1 hypothetical protein, conserved [Babesia bigemina]|eukprot:XP_012768438.1 hypothetical protein, conserved [Babesia bigemina]